jgi:hypothetical protein
MRWPLIPSHAIAHGNLGVLLRVLSRHEESEAEYRRAMRSIRTTPTPITISPSC